MLTNAQCLAIQIEAMEPQIEKLFSVKLVPARVDYRYSWEKNWRSLGVCDWVIANDKLMQYFVPTTDEELVRKVAAARLKRYRYTDKAGRVRRVKEIRVYLQ